LAGAWDVGYNYFQKLNFCYWQHRVVQFDVVAHLGMGGRMEVQAGDGRADLVFMNPMDASATPSVAEVKPLGAGATGVQQLNEYVRALKGTKANLNGFNWPVAGAVHVPLTTITVGYQASAFAGIYEHELTGAIPVWNDWKEFDRVSIRQYVASLATSGSGIPFPSLDGRPGWEQGLHLTGYVALVIATDGAALA
jgi:hypothetical protein